MSNSQNICAVSIAVLPVEMHVSLPASVRVQIHLLNALLLSSQALLLDSLLLFVFQVGLQSGSKVVGIIKLRSYTNEDCSKNEAKLRTKSTGYSLLKTQICIGVPITASIPVSKVVLNTSFKTGQKSLRRILSDRYLKSECSQAGQIGNGVSHTPQQSLCYSDEQFPLRRAQIHIKTTNRQSKERVSKSTLQDLFLMEAPYKDKQLPQLTWRGSEAVQSLELKASKREPAGATSEKEQFSERIIHTIQGSHHHPPSVISSVFSSLNMNPSRSEFIPGESPYAPRSHRNHMRAHIPKLATGRLVEVNQQYFGRPQQAKRFQRAMKGNSDQWANRLSFRYSEQNLHGVSQSAREDEGSEKKK